MKPLAVVLFLACIGGVLYFLLSMFTDMEQGHESYEVLAFFENTGGVNEGNPIKMAGKHIGKVGEIRLDLDRRGVLMSLEIFSNIKIPADSKLSVAEKGMLGEMYLSFSFGSESIFLKPNDEVKGRAPTSLSEVMGQAGEVLDGAGVTLENTGKELSQFLKHLNEVMASEGFKENLQGAVMSLSVTLGETSALMTNNRPKLRELIGNLSRSSNLLNNSLSTLERQLSQLETSQTIQRLGEVMERLANLTSNVDAMSSTELPLMVKRLSALMSVGELTMGELHEGLKKIQPALSKLSNAEEGTLGKLFHDGALYDNLNHMLSSGAELLELLEEQPSALIFGRREASSAKTPRASSGVKRFKNVKGRRYLVPEMSEEK